MKLKEEITRVRGTLAAAAERGDRSPEIEHARLLLHDLCALARDVEQRDRVAAASALDVAGVSKRMKQLQAADTALGPCARAELRTRVETETDAIDRRVAQLNAPAGSSAPGADETAAARERARATYRTLQRTNPIAASAFAARAGDSVLFEYPPPEDAA